MWILKNKNSVKQTILGIVLMLGLSTLTQAATIVVDGADGSVANDGICSISEAMINANDDAATHGDCLAGSGYDTIELTADITLSAFYENDVTYGQTATPAIASPIVLDGMGYTLQRDSSLACNNDDTLDSSEFRLLRITANGDLDLKNIALKHGCADGNGNSSFGGAIYTQGTLKINSSLIASNQARFSGGIDNFGSIEIINSTFSGNSAVVNGGGIYNNPNGVIGVINNSTFSGNIAINGGGIVNSSSATITTLSNSLFHNNIGTNADCLQSGGSVVGDNNLSNQSSSSCGSVIDMTNLDPTTVGPLADNGGLTMTHALLAGSQAIDAGDMNATTHDQRGFNHDGSRDIGAFEYLTVTEQCLQLGMDNAQDFEIDVPSTSMLNQAILCANLNAATTDTINLSADITYSSFYEDDATYGQTATPAITSPIVLDGMGHTLQRDNSLTCNNDGTLDSSEFRLLRITANGDLDLKNIELKHGCADGSGDLSFGGAIHTRGTLKINRSLIASNQAQSSGGIDNQGDISEINNSTFSGNSAVGGGGIYNFNGTINKINNSTFSGNSAVEGGGIYNFIGTINKINNSTFSGNSAVINGGGIVNASATITTLSNSLFHNNTGTNADCFLASGSIGGDNNLSNQSSSSCGSVIDMTNLNPTTVGPLADNGGLTMTHALLAGSEAIDAGDANATNHDQRGFAANGIRDIGAFEYDGIDDLIFKNGFE